MKALDICSSYEKILKRAAEYAGELGQLNIDTIHVAAALCEAGCFDCRDGLGTLTVGCVKYIRESCGAGERTRLNIGDASGEVLCLLEQAMGQRRRYTKPTATVLALTMLETDCHGSRMLRKLGVNFTKSRLRLEPCAKRTGAADTAQMRPASTKSFERYGVDLTKLASSGQLDPVIGREQEIDRVVAILSRRKKNNPCLVGEPGVGKTAIAEGLAMLIAEGNPPKALKNKTVFSLDLASIVAGTKYRGDFEERLKNIMTEISRHHDFIIFIDEIHNIVGAGSAEGSIDAANILKPVLARGEIQLIGATTLSEFHRHIEKDEALARRFQTVMVKEPTLDEALEIARRVKAGYERFHEVDICDEALLAAVELSERYIINRRLPDKALDVLDEARSEAACRGAASVTENDIAAVISRAAGIPAARITEAEGRRLSMLEERLSERVIGQKSAIHAVCRAITRSRMGLREKKRPIGAFLFLGPTGVGKTELCKALAEEYFGGKNNLITLNMGEYSEPQSVAKLIGAAPGYVGYGDGRHLCERVADNPHCVVLFDEAEKAHPEVFNTLLSILEEGELCDSCGKPTSFKNSIIILTSNVGGRLISAGAQLLGFCGAENGEATVSLVRREAERQFLPEFLNRMDEIVVFNRLSADNIREIAALVLSDLAVRAAENGIRIVFSESAVSLIASLCSGDRYGARPMKRAVSELVEDPLCELMLTGRLHSGDRAEIAAVRGKIVFCVNCGAELCSVG